MLERTGEDGSGAKILAPRTEAAPGSSAVQWKWYSFAGGQGDWEPSQRSRLKEGIWKSRSFRNEAYNKGLRVLQICFLLQIAVRNRCSRSVYTLKIQKMTNEADCVLKEMVQVGQFESPTKNPGVNALRLFPIVPLDTG